MVNSHTPVKIMDGVVRIAVSGNTCYAETSDGRIWIWGDNANVILTTPTVVNVPITIDWNGRPQTSISTTHTLEIHANGTFWAWGSNDSGQLGNGTFLNQANPVQIIMLSDIHQTPDGRFQYMTESGGITITRYLGNEQTPVIPAAIDNAVVLKIGDNAFANNPAIRTITIPNGVTTIGKNAFSQCPALIEVTFPASLRIIDTEAFRGNNLLARVTIPANVTVIGEWAFGNCGSLTTVKFEHTNALSLITFGTNNNNNNVFNGHPASFFIHYPPGATNFTTPTWMGYPAAPDPGSINDFDYTIAANGDVHITRYLGSAASVSIPAMIAGRPVRSIERRAFENNATLVTLTIPNGVTRIGEQAFIGCANLTRVTIPASVVSIEERAFAHCARLTDARFLHPDADNIVVFGSQIFAGAAPTFKITYPDNARNFTTPQWRGYPAEPHNATSEFEYILESGGITITRYRGTAAVPLIPTTFDDMAGFQVLRIDAGAFENNANITHISIPNTVTSIGPRAFAGCSSLVGVNIPASVTVIGNNAFRDNPRLQYARFEHASAANIATFGSNIFDGHANNFTIIYPRDAAVFTQPTWQGYPSRMDHTSPADFTFTSANNQSTITRFNGNASHVDIPSHLGGFPVTRIGDFAFNGNHVLTYVSIPADRDGHRRASL
jgi:hypothetical protein